MYRTLLPLISLLLIGCTATVEVDPRPRPDAKPAANPEITIEHVDAALVAEWAECLRVTRAGLARWYETTRGNPAEYMEALRRLSALMRQYLAGVGDQSKPSRSGETPLADTGSTWGAPPTANTQATAAVLARGVEALEGLGDE